MYHITMTYIPDHFSPKLCLYTAHTDVMLQHDNLSTLYPYTGR